MVPPSQSLGRIPKILQKVHRVFFEVLGMVFDGFVVEDESEEIAVCDTCY